MKTIAARCRGSYFSYVLVFFFYYFAMSVFSSVLSVYLTGIGKSASEMSFIVSSSGLFSFAVVPAAGYLSDRTGKPKLISCVLLLAAGGLGLIFAAGRSVWVLFLLNGFIMSFVNSVMPVCERMAAASRYRYGSLRVWGTLGYAAAAQCAGAALDLVSPSCLLVMLLIYVLLAVLGFLGTDPIGEEPARETEESAPRLASLLKNSQYLLFLVVALLFSGCSGVNMTYAPILLTSLGVPAGAVGTVLLFSTLTEIPIILFSNKFMDRFSSKSLLLVDFGVIITQFLFYGFCRSAIPVVTAMILLKAIASTLFVMITLKVVRSLVDSRFTTTGLSVVNSVSNLGIIALQNGGGLLVDRTNVHVLYFLMAALTALGMALTLFLRADQGKKVFG